VQWTNCPVEVAEEVKRLWVQEELRNDDSFFWWNSDDEVSEEYLIIAEYLKERGITECWIRYWW